MTKKSLHHKSTKVLVKDSCTKRNKLTREQNGTTNSNDRLHAAKGTLKGMKIIAFSPKKKKRGRGTSSFLTNVN